MDLVQQHEKKQAQYREGPLAQFLDSAYTGRELLVSLIECVELTEDKQIIIKFCFCGAEDETIHAPSGAAGNSPSRVE